ncbi:unnamed protein product [Arctia plantaginis]|uniref:Uncharacterized protein n=1 Tax=Arctia plantaginis TaxID=874455 RepID=A0A8S1B7V5_ARCPL|nr:unnamed protein product [Arctia plantaginis]
MYGRRKILLFHGLVEDKKEDTSQVVASLIKFEQEHFNVKDIKRCQRLGRQVGQDKGRTGTQKTRPILVKLPSVLTRDNIWFSKTKLKGSSVTVSEFLTKTRHDIFISARERYGVNNCWTMQGYVYVLRPDGKQHRVSALAELNGIGDSCVKPAATAKAVTTKSKRAAAKK